ADAEPRAPQVHAPGQVAPAASGAPVRSLARTVRRAGDLHRREPLAEGVHTLRSRPAGGLLQPVDAGAASGPEYRAGTACAGDFSAAAPVRTHCGTGSG